MDDEEDGNEGEVCNFTGEWRQARPSGVYSDIIDALGFHCFLFRCCPCPRYAYRACHSTT